MRVKCKLEEASRPPAAPARSAPYLHRELALRLPSFLFKFVMGALRILFKFFRILKGLPFEI